MTRATAFLIAILALQAGARALERDAFHELIRFGVLPHGTRVTRDVVADDARAVTLAWPVSGRPSLDEATLDALLEAFPPPAEVRGLALYLDDPAAPGGRVALRELLPPVRPVAPKPGEGVAALGAVAVAEAAPIPVVVPVDAPGQQAGALSGKHVYVSQGHGWTWTSYGWRTQRGNTWGAVEDFLNAEAVDQYLLRYLQNAGATTWPLREPDLNPSMVLVDDGDGTNHPENGTYEEVGDGFATSTAPGFANTAPPWDSGDDVMTAGASRYHYTSVAGGPLARFTPTLPAAGRYHVTASWSASPNRASDAHFRVRHAGGATDLRVDQKRHGATWVDLGEFWFAAGHDPEHGAVEILTDSADKPGQTVVVLDAVRFGGGLGLLRRGSGTGTLSPTSERPRWQENCRYSAQFNGAPADVYDYRDEDGADDVVARSRYAAWQHEQGEDAVYVSWHTNAPAPAQGTSTYVYGPNGPPSPFSEFSGAAGSDRLAELLHAELLNDIRQGYDPTWQDRGLHTAWFGEVNPDHNNEMPSVLVEVGFHDTEAECLKMQDPKFRNLAARAFYQGVVRYFAEKDGTEPVFLPEPPTAFRVASAGPDRARLSWAAPPTDAPSTELGAGEGVLGDAPTGYVLYHSTDGRAFDNGAALGPELTAEIDAAPGVVHFYRLTAVNAGGQSFATPVLALSQPAPGQRPALIVGGFDRLDRFSQVSEDLSAYDLGIVQHMLLDRMNAYDYVVPHALALAALGLPFVSAWHDAPLTGGDLLAHAFVLWQAGEESTADETFSEDELAHVEAYASGGGTLLVTGAEVGWDLVELGQGDEPARFRALFSADYVSDDAGTTTLSLADGTEATIDDGTGGAYDVDYPDVLAPLGEAAAFAFYGADQAQVAGVWAKTPAGGGVALLGVPLEAVEPASARVALLALLSDVLELDAAVGQPIETPPELPVEPTPEAPAEVQDEPGPADPGAPDPGLDPGPDPRPDLVTDDAVADVTPDGDGGGDGSGGSCAIGGIPSAATGFLSFLALAIIVARPFGFPRREERS